MSISKYRTIRPIAHHHPSPYSLLHPSLSYHWFDTCKKTKKANSFFFIVACRSSSLCSPPFVLSLPFLSFPSLLLPPHLFFPFHFLFFHCSPSFSLLPFHSPSQTRSPPSLFSSPSPSSIIALLHISLSPALDSKITLFAVLSSVSLYSSSYLPSPFYPNLVPQKQKIKNG